MAKQRNTSDEALELFFSIESFDDDLTDSSGSDADTWCSDEECSSGIDPFEDHAQQDEREDALPTAPSLLPEAEGGEKEDPAFQQKRQRATPFSSTISAPQTSRGRERGESRGRGRGKISKTGSERQHRDVLHGYEEQGPGWNGPEVADMTPRLPNFFPKRSPGIQGFVGATYSPAQIFRQFFSDAAVKCICKNTNINAEKEKSRGKKLVWEDLKPVTFMNYVGLMIYMALLKLHKVRDYWRTGSHLSVHFPASIMSRDRFLAIHRTVHLSNPEQDVANDQKKDTPEYDPLHRLKPLYTAIKNACMALWQPRKQIAIDERMVATKAKISLRQYMKAKPIKWGVKLFVLADSSNGYTCDFTIYTGKSRFSSGQGLSYDVVSNLMDPSFLGRGYHLYVDNFYTSPKLFRDLYASGFVACGTFRDSRRNVSLTKQNALTSQSPRGTIRWIRQQELLFVKWMDTREVTVCSTIHQAFDGDTVSRNVHDKETGRWQRKNFASPRAVVDYNKYMGGVDLSDQLLQYYSVHRRSNRWYRTLLYHFIDIATTNSYILHKEMCLSSQTAPMSHSQFMEELSAELCGVPKGSDIPPRGAQCLPESLASGDEAAECEWEKRRSADTATKGRRYCVLCKKRTIWKCARCDVALCLVAHRNCFSQWHSGRGSQDDT